MTKEYTQTQKTNRTQWTAQFLTAGELARRFYTVSFTMGNHTPVADLIVGSPSGHQFWVDVKGLSSRNFWLLHEKPAHVNLFYVLVYVDPTREGDLFFVLSQANANSLIRAYIRDNPKMKHQMVGFNWTTPHRFKDAWETLPR